MAILRRTSPARPVIGPTQRFLDLEDDATEAKADDRALEAAKDWIDAHPARENLYPPRTGFTPLI